MYNLHSGTRQPRPALPAPGVSSPFLSLCFSCSPRGRSWEETQGDNLRSQTPWMMTGEGQPLPGILSLLIGDNSCHLA